jgi:hypothetical protein
VSDDDLIPFIDDPLVQALRAPAAEHELAGEEAALAMFRQSLPARRRRRRALTRAGVTGAGVLLGLGLTGGVAAAYTTGLPDPVQDAVHSVIDPLPIPAPPSAHVLRLRHQFAAARRRALARARAEATPTPTPRHIPRPSHQPTPGPRVLPPPTANGSHQQPSAAPSPTASPVRPTMTVAVSQSRVPVHTQVILSGRLSRGGTALPGRVVYAAELPAGASTWRRVANARTASDGTISLTVPALTTNVRLRLVTAQGVTSTQLPVAVVPKLTTTAARSGNDRVVTVTADGGRPGDVLKLFRRDGATWTPIASTTLGSGSTGQFTVPGPAATRVRYLVRLPATARHAVSFVEFVVPAR